jgi:uncharacterized protein (DUF1778 family)
MASSTERKETRLVARTSPELEEIVQRTADYSGATLSQFLVDSAIEKALNVIETTVAGSSLVSCNKATYLIIM